MNEAPLDVFYPADKQQWRNWLQENHDQKQSVWLIFYKTKSGMRTLSWSEAVDEALCFGWIDSKAKPIDSEKYMQFFSRRKKASGWSKVNKDKVQKLIANGAMTQAGLKSIEIAKQNGSRTLLDEIEALVIPDDLEMAFTTHTGAKDFFLSLSKSVRKRLLHWVVVAKQAETRKKRILEVAECACLQRIPKQFA